MANRLDLWRKSSLEIYVGLKKSLNIHQEIQFLLEASDIVEKIVENIQSPENSFKVN